jgi:hypothetical protein
MSLALLLGLLSSKSVLTTSAMAILALWASSNRWSRLDGESEVGRPRSVDRTRPLQFDPPTAEILEESCAVAEQDGDNVDLHLVQ